MALNHSIQIGRGIRDPQSSDGLVDGELYYNKSTNKLFIGNNNTLINVQGPTGPTGAKGATGAIGATGPTGPSNVSIDGSYYQNDSWTASYSGTPNWKAVAGNPSNGYNATIQATISGYNDKATYTYSSYTNSNTSIQTSYSKIEGNKVNFTLYTSATSNPPSNITVKAYGNFTTPELCELNVNGYIFKIVPTTDNNFVNFVFTRPSGTGYTAQFRRSGEYVGIFTN